jgi:hypothetical protein
LSNALNCILFSVIPKHWVVERLFDCLEKCRRLWKNTERLLNTSLQFVNLAFCYEDFEQDLKMLFYMRYFSTFDIKFRIEIQGNICRTKCQG